MVKHNKKRKPYNNEEDDEIQLNKKQCIQLCAKCDRTELNQIGTYCVRCKWCKDCYLENICAECSTCVNCHEPFRSCELTKQTEYSRNLCLRYFRNVKIVKQILAKIPDSGLKSQLDSVLSQCKYQWKSPLSMIQIIKYVEISLLLDNIENTVQTFFDLKNTV